MIWTPPGLEQPEKGYRFSTDAFLLASFASGFPSRSWCDLGTGSGVIAWELARRIGGRGVAIERQKPLLQYARKNLEATPVTLIHGDLCRYPWKPAAFDMIVCNPPYYDVGAGRINKETTHAHARHTFYGGVLEFADAMKGALEPEGLFCYVFPYHLHGRPLEKLKNRGWYIHHRLLVSSFAGREPKLICLALSPTPSSEPNTRELVIYQAHREFTDAMQWFLEKGVL